MVELKAVTNLHPLHTARLLSYLRLSNTRIGLLLNFHECRMKDGIVRLIHSAATTQSPSGSGTALAVAPAVAAAIAVAVVIAVAVAVAAAVAVPQKKSVAVLRASEPPR